MVWVEEGVVEGNDKTLQDDDDASSVYAGGDDGGTSSRSIVTDDSISTSTSYFSTFRPQSDTLTSTLESYDPVGC